MKCLIFVLVAKLKTIMYFNNTKIECKKYKLGKILHKSIRVSLPLFVFQI